MNNFLILINARGYQSLFPYSIYDIKIFDKYLNILKYKKELEDFGIEVRVCSEGNIVFLQLLMKVGKLEKLLMDNYGSDSVLNNLKEALSRYLCRKRVIKTASREIVINEGSPLIMGILNVTPDSFYNGGRYVDVEAAVEHALAMEQEGADIIDVGGQSTRPGSVRLGAEREIERVVPVIEKLGKLLRIPISIDTYYSEVAEEAIKNGVEIVNDTSALTYDEERMLGLVKKTNVAICLMHYYKTLQPMPQEPYYSEIMYEIISWLKRRIDILIENDVNLDKVIVDPGIGFGKTVNHNLQIMHRLDEMKVLGLPILVGVSRKSFIGKVLSDSGPEDRLEGTLASCITSMMKGASILRVHDVKEIKRAITIVNSILNGT